MQRITASVTTGTLYFIISFFFFLHIYSFILLIRGKEDSASFFFGVEKKKLLFELEVTKRLKSARSGGKQVSGWLISCKEILVTGFLLVRERTKTLFIPPSCRQTRFRLTFITPPRLAPRVSVSAALGKMIKNAACHRAELRRAGERKNVIMYHDLQAHHTVLLTFPQKPPLLPTNSTRLCQRHDAAADEICLG